MAISELYSGTATISTTEYSLVNNSTVVAAITTDVVPFLFVDFANMVAGDEYEIACYEKVTSGGTARRFVLGYVVGTQSEPFQATPGLLMHGWDITITRRAGTNRSISWSIRAVT